MDINIKVEPTDIQVDNAFNIKVKEENELIIESENRWMPIKLEDEQNEYQEFVEDYGEVVYPEKLIKNEFALKNEPAFEQYTIEYLDENEDYDDGYVDDSEDDENSNDYYGESNVGDKTMNHDNEGEGSEKEFNMASEYNLDLKNYALSQEEKQDKQLSDTESKVLCKFTLNKWLLNNYVRRECPTCNQQFTYYIEWRKHIESVHQDVIKESESNYEITDRVGVCKKCGRDFVTEFTRYLHSIRHTENAEILDINICKVCNFSSSKYVFLQKHIIKEHPETIEEFEKSGNMGDPFKCPICNYNYSKYYQLWYHFMDNHPQEFIEKFRYNCHLCLHDPFAEEEIFLEHLIGEHELNSWMVLNFRKLFEDKEYYACEKCHIIFIKNDTRTFLKHFLEHETSCYWRCKFCRKKNPLKFENSSHMCLRLLQHFTKRSKNEKHKTQDSRTIGRWKLRNLQEFEEYITHVCPFCKTEFNKMLKWQQHLRKIHKIDTLKGLEMKIIPTDSNKLCCVLCYTVVPNAPMQLHAHRFQHLPYKPYKCQHCTQPLDTFKMAVNHVLKRCEDEEDREYIKRVLVPKTIEPSNCVRTKVEIQCAFCNYQKFPDSKDLIKHYEEEHNNFEEFFSKHPKDNTLTCNVCQKQCVQYDHVRNHFAEKAFNCPLCVHSYITFRGCYRHLLLKHFVKPLCEQEPVKQKNHITEASSFPNKPNSEIPQLAKPGIKTYVLNEFAEFITFACPECNEGMSKQEDWHRHITTEHNFFEESNLYFKDADGSLKCPTCKLNMPTCTTQQQKHKLTHMPYRSFICNLCYARCNSLGVLYGHFRRKHFAQGNFECPICRIVLPTAHQQTEHLKNAHPREEWPISTCLICYKVLATKSGLNNHMATHDGERPKYTCDICQSKLIGLKDFKFHMARHGQKGEVPEQKNKTEDGEVPFPSGSKCNQSDNVEENKDLERNKNVPKAKKKNVAKRKSLITTSSITKKMKTDT